MGAPPPDESNDSQHLEWRNCEKKYVFFLECLRKKPEKYFTVKKGESVNHGDYENINKPDFYLSVQRWKTIIFPVFLGENVQFLAS